MPINFHSQLAGDALPIRGMRHLFLLSGVNDADTVSVIEV